MLIGLTGRKQAGKDTTYARISAHYGDVVRRASFADLLYRSAAEALGVTVDQLAEWKSSPAVRVTVHGPDGVAFSGMTIREYLQRYGTEAHRDVFGTDFWVDNCDLAHHGEIVVVTDVRFPNEAAAIRQAGGTIVRVFGTPEVEAVVDGHASEAPLPDRLVDATIYNTVRGLGFTYLDGQVLDLVGELLRSRVR